jgi:hypothetical protein
MDHAGLALASRYSYPPNSFSLCGPQKQKDLSWYAARQLPDKGNAEILTQFKTLYPYLTLIAGSNHIKDPFDKRVVEAYWIGNSLLKNISVKDYVRFLDEPIALAKKEKREVREKIYEKIAIGALPHHSFHVLNIYKRTGSMDIPHTVETMDACIINWGTITEILRDSVVVSTNPLRRIKDVLGFDTPTNRRLKYQGYNDTLHTELHIGDVISYHWGYICEKLTPQKIKLLTYYTNISLRLANLSS